MNAPTRQAGYESYVLIHNSSSIIQNSESIPCTVPNSLICIGFHRQQVTDLWEPRRLDVSIPSAKDGVERFCCITRRNIIGVGRGSEVQLHQRGMGHGISVWWCNINSIIGEHYKNMRRRPYSIEYHNTFRASRFVAVLQFHLIPLHPNPRLKSIHLCTDIQAEILDRIREFSQQNRKNV